jgi:hypothetical protein
MRNLKFLVPFLLLIVIIAVTGFSQSGNVKKSVNKASRSLDPPIAYCFSYIGPSTVWSFSEYTDPANYVILPDDTYPEYYCGYGDEALCTILCERYWDGFDWKPDFSNTGYGSAYWGLYNFYTTGYPATSSVILKDL